MSIGALDATKAYGKVASLGNTLSKAAGGGEIGSDQPSGFGAMVENLVGGTADKLRTAEAASAKQVAGKGDLIDVVTAIGAAETALDTMVAVRDRVVGAYTDIMRMQI
ncbi:Flagellar hook-basal body complex protein FliE [Sphingomonas sp. S2M10]|uniref:flagellar hook-basal body complex protein FliE n=1 Tax=Sphingomonas sp. S2M10 TaxID=2705010 RepID=UPI0014568349|nr:flagellar hook-basal body complex protein FliE [Sphingomonas sp. S2M10]NLS25587.1 Flagellar hook-basal body complex protein FliE [Sphingomonas sp. S2M10]